MTWHSLLLFVAIGGLASCKVASKQVTGNYICTSFDDTLHIYADGSYDYTEMLNSGNSGWTEGKWVLKNRKVHFECDHKPLVGYKLRIRRDTATNNFQLRLLLSDTDEPIYVEDAKIYKNDSILSSDNFKKSGNQIKIYNTNFDSIVVTTFNFTDLTFENSPDTSHGYIVRIYPSERLYELDKVPFLFKKNTLNGISTKECDNINIAFKKIGN